ncbi:MAG: imidazole glycerol phosphate synthase subunit HisH [Ruminococcaceae bacterium]|nr:imidazole glycerol phosphate synthase subunit HisH [Oscillospiraceae bacterium]
MKLAIIDYGAGNLRSVVKAFNFIGEDCVVTSDRETIHSCSGIVLPGVGAFREAVNKLEAKGLCDILKKEAESGKALFGICLGMQLLFDESYEFGHTDGLGFINGSVEKIDTNGADLKIPHIGWNTLKFNEKSNLFSGIEDNSYVYFVHSFAAKTDSKNVTAYTDYGTAVVAAAENKNVCGTQFHPEKSGEVGLKILKNFCNTVRHDNFTCN